VNVKSRQAPCAANYEDETYQPSELIDVDGLSGFAEGQIANTPGVCQECWGYAETDNIGERIELLAEFAVCPESARDSPIEGVEKYGEADRARGVFEIGVAAFEGGQDGVIAAEKIGDRKRTGKKIRAALRRFANGSAAVFVWVI